MRQWTRKLNTEMCIDNVAKMMEKTKLEELPHYDTMNDFLASLPPEESENIRTYMIKKLLEKRCFEKNQERQIYVYSTDLRVTKKFEKVS